MATSSGAPNEKVTRIIQGHLMPIRDKMKEIIDSIT
jgi:hypothetical protein